LNTLQSPGLDCRLRKVIRYSRKRAFPERDQNLQNFVSLGEIQTASRTRTV